MAVHCEAFSRRHSGWYGIPLMVRGNNEAMGRHRADPSGAEHAAPAALH